jgi:selenocysteine-specific translation elongation factor
MDKRKLYWDQYYEKNKEIMKEKSSIQYNQNKLKNPNYSRDYYRKNKEKLKQYHKEYQKKAYSIKKRSNIIPVRIINKQIILSFD